MRWSEEKAFKGLTCSECGWLFPNPKKFDFPNDMPDEEKKKQLFHNAQNDFDSHDCAKYPKTPKPIT